MVKDSPTWNQLINARRLGNREPNSEAGRSPFNKDHDKIIFSGAFRRLAKKTQVHPLAQNDHIHNRLTHSLEVSCVGRTLGINVGQQLQQAGDLPDGINARDIGDIVETACLSHDIGNPPFGHTGEEAIREWFSTDGEKYLSALSAQQKQDFLHWEGNAQGLRVLTTSEYHPYNGGMHLTYSTLAASLKYPWTSQHICASEGRKKFGAFYHEQDYLREIAQATGMTPCGDKTIFIRHPLVLLVEAADDFCYGIIDMEDGYEMGLLRWSEILETAAHLLSDDDMAYLEKKKKEMPESRCIPHLRGRIIARCVTAATEAFHQHEAGIRAGTHNDLIELCHPEVVKYVKNTKEIAKEKIFKSERKTTLEIGAYGVISELLEKMCRAATLFAGKSEKLSFKDQRVIDLLGLEQLNAQFARQAGYAVKDNDERYFYLMRVMDFLSGMTDQYALYLNGKFRGIE
ncbi:MAG TPA: deoxyguanosinetriphosphate triphosphohydrolase [Marinagarivorans sp.]